MRDNSLTIFSQIIENDNMIFLSVHTLNTTSFYKFTKNAFTSLFYYTGVRGTLHVHLLISEELSLIQPSWPPTCVFNKLASRHVRVGHS